MKCERCGATLAEGDEIDHLGERICEDCYMDLRNPAKACDPWAVKLATSQKEQSGEVELTVLQGRIIEELGRDQYVTPEDMAKRLGIATKELQQNVATLRHLEMVRGEKRDGIVYLTSF